MKRRICCFIILISTLLATTSISPISSKPSSPYLAAIDQTPRTQHVQEPAFEGNEGMENGYKKTGRGLSRIGSRPPRCEHKCKGCVPCDPIQIPTSRGHRVQYANYEPEGWKCKCGTSYYNP